MDSHKSINEDGGSDGLISGPVYGFYLGFMAILFGVIAQLYRSLEGAIACLRISMAVFSINFATAIWGLKQTAAVNSNQYQAFRIFFYSTLFVAPASLIVFFVLEPLRLRFSGYACHMLRWMYNKFIENVNQVIGSSPFQRPVVTTINMSAAETEIPEATDLGIDIESPTTTNANDLDLGNKKTATE